MNKTRKISFLLKGVVALMYAASAKSATSQTTVAAGNVIGCHDYEVLIPVFAENLEDVAAVTLYIYMDTVNTGFIGLQDINNEFEGGSFISNLDENVLKITWFSTSSAEIDSGLMFNIKVIFKTGVANPDILDSSEFADSNLGIIENITYVDGSITDISNVQPLPEIQSVELGSNTDISLDYANADNFDYQWQINYGQQWQDIVDDNTFNGVTTNMLVVSDVSQELNNVKFRCEIDGENCSGYTKESSLHVLPGGIGETVAETSIVYPNPVNDVLHLTLSGEYKENCLVRFSDVYGRAVMEYVLTRADYQNKNAGIDMNNYPRGLYFISVNENSNRVKTFKVLKN